jgi:hypothetical protein
MAITSCCLWGILIRNGISTMVVSFVVPVVLSIVLVVRLEMLADKFWMNSPDLDRANFVMNVWLSAGAVYGILTGVLAVFFWRRLQLTGETNTVSKLDAGVTARFIGDQKFRKLPAWFTLVRKEIGLLRYMAWITGVFLVGALFFLVVDRTLDHLIADASSKLLPGRYLPLDEGVVWWQSGLRGIAAALFAVQLTLVPMLCGALAFTEEAYLGNRAWQLCQPVRSHWQCLIKFAIAFGVSVFTGLLLPAVEVVVCSSVFTNEIMNPGAISQTVTLHFLLFSVAAWCATWSRASFTSVVKAFLLVTGFIFATTVLTPAIDAKVSLLLGFNSSPFGSVPDWRWPAWGLTFMAVAATLLNFRSPDLPTRRWLGQGAAFTVLVFMLVFVLFRLR